MSRRLLLLATLSCAPLSATPGPAGPPPTHVLEVQREFATSVLVDRTASGPETSRAIAALGRIGDPAAIDRLRLLLTARPTRADAAHALGIARLLGADTRDAAFAMLTLWPDAPPHDRVAMIEALGRLGSPVALPTLAAALRDGPPLLREPAAIALGVLGRKGVAFDDQARGALVAASTDSTLHYAVAYALAHEHEPTHRELADEAILNLSESLSAETRYVALTGLTRRKLPPAFTRPRFTRALQDRDFRVRTAAVRGLLALGDRASLATLMSWLRAAVADPLAAQPALEALAALADLPRKPGSPPEWTTHLDPLADAAEALADLSHKPPDLSHKPPDLSQRTADLAHNPPDLAHKPPDPSQRTADGTSPAARIACRARALLARHTGTGAPACPGVPAPLAQTLTAGALPRAELEALRHDLDPRVRTAAVAALLARSIPTAYLKVLFDPSPAVAGTLAEALGGATSPQISTTLRTALAARASHELHHEVELYITLTTALATIKGPVEPCTAGLTHPNFSVRAAARTCVTALTGADPGPQLPAAPAPPPPHAPQPGARIHWRLTTTRGVVDIDLDPFAAPWNVAALVANTRAGFYDGLTFHRVVPGFVVQGGDPEGTGWGGPGYTLPSEPGPARFTRGAVGIADAGKDTGGCQFFIMHARAPHLEGRYTWVGAVTRGQDVVDALLIGDTITRAEILP